MTCQQNSLGSRGASRAFTLVEMLIAICIVGVLAMLTVTGMGALTRRAQDTKCESNLRQIYLALSAYAMDHGGEYPAVRDIGPPQVYWYMALASYAGGEVKPGKTFGDSRSIAPIFRCPGAKADFKAPSDSDIFRSYTATDSMKANLTSESDWNKPVRPATIAAPSKTLICVDGAKTSTGTDYACDSGVKFKFAEEKIGYRHGKSKEGNAYGKDGYANGLFFDGHVAPLKSGDITQGMWDKPLL